MCVRWSNNNSLPSNLGLSQEKNLGMCLYVSVELVQNKRPDGTLRASSRVKWSSINAEQ